MTVHELPNAARFTERRTPKRKSRVLIIQADYPCYACEEPRMSTGWINIKNHNYIANYISRIY